MRVLTFMSILLAIAGILVTLALFLLPEGENKDLDVAILSDSSPTESLSALGGNAALYWKGKQVPVLRVTELLVENVGNRAIKPDDFDGPLEFGFDTPEDYEVLEASVTRTSPPELQPGLDASSSVVARIMPLLLNEGDSVGFRMIGTAPLSAPLRIRARIAGVKQVDLESLVLTSEDGGESSTSDLAVAIAASTAVTVGAATAAATSKTGAAALRRWLSRFAS